jgi:hypothetical protein
VVTDIDLGEVAAPNYVGDARIAADALKLGLHLARRCRSGRRSATGRRRGARHWLASVTICRVVVPEPVSSAVWPRVAGLQLDVARQGVIGSDGREAEAMTEKLTNAIVHRDMGESPLARHRQ